MELEIREFIAYLHDIKKTSINTEMSYQRDLKKMWDFLKNRGVMSVSEVKELELEGYISYMEREKFAASSISRSVASIRAFFQFLWKEGVITSDPAELERAEAIIRPGVGAFPDAAERPRGPGLDQVLTAQAQKKPVLGICLGMQLLFDCGNEVRDCKGL